MSNGSPPIQPAPVPPSIAGIVQPVFASGDAATPATPISITGTPILPPPQVGFGNNVLVGPAIAPAPVPPSTAGFAQPQYATGSGTVPTVASLFPAFTAAGPNPPIVINAAQNVSGPPSPPAAPPAWIAPPALPLPTTPGTTPILPGAGALAPFNIRDPVISGTPTAGQVITVSNGVWVNYPTSFTYVWYRNGALIAGQTTNSYTVLASDKGDAITATVTATNAAGSATASSANVVPSDVQGDPPPDAPPPASPPSRTPFVPPLKPTPSSASHHAAPVHHKPAHKAKR